MKDIIIWDNARKKMPFGGIVDISMPAEVGQALSSINFVGRYK